MPCASSPRSASATPARQGIENRESCFFNRFGQLIYKEPRGRIAGYDMPEIGIHRGRLHLTSLSRPRAHGSGADTIITDHQCVGVEQDEDGDSHSQTGQPANSSRCGPTR